MQCAALVLRVFGLNSALGSFSNLFHITKLNHRGLASHDIASDRIQKKDQRLIVSTFVRPRPTQERTLKEGRGEGDWR